jgi:predicted DCC family thiol-disulfide oxidoreductase YuxK
VKLLYDDDCGVCARSVAWLARRTTGVVFAPLDGPADAVVVLTDDATTLTGAPAIAAVLARTAGPWRYAGRVIATPGVSSIAAVAYRLVARNRHRISRTLGWGSCPVPPR